MIFYSGWVEVGTLHWLYSETRIANVAARVCPLDIQYHSIRPCLTRLLIYVSLTGAFVIE